MVRIVWCAGHGYNTGGKRTPDGEREWTFNDKVGRAFASELSKYNNVELKRMDDPTGKTDVPLDVRTKGANTWKADWYVSFHHNANTSKWGTWTGVETFVYTKNLTAKSGALAKAIQPALVSAYGLKDRGVKEANLAIVRDTNMPAILIEGGFMDSTIDIKKLRDDKVLADAGVKVAQAMAKHLGLTLKVVAPAPKPTVVAPAATVSNAAVGISHDASANNKVEALNRPGRYAARALIVANGVTVQAVNTYTDIELISNALVAINAKLNK